MTHFDFYSFLIGFTPLSFITLLLVYWLYGAHKERMALRMEKASESQLLMQFKNLSNEALQQNNQQFLDLAKENLSKMQKDASHDLENRQNDIKQMVSPLKDSLEKVNFQIREMETKRSGAYEGMKAQIHSLLEVQNHLRSETQQLSQALKSPVSRGRWGEIQLRRVVELAGMIEHCDFVEQTTTTNDEGRKLRPDLIVQLPGKKRIIIDAKSPLSAYMSAVESPDISAEARKNYFQAHARQVRDHIKALSSKNYWAQFEGASAGSSPEFVVMFLPGENFFSAALEYDSKLIEYGIEAGVILATPTTLIALLRAVAYGWRQEALTENAQKISSLGGELYKRLFDMSKHFSSLGSQLNKSVQSYNKTIGSFDHRVMVTARKFAELNGKAPEDFPALEPIDQQSRLIQD